MKVWADGDERYPVFALYKRALVPDIYFEIEVTDEEYAEYERALAAWDRVQDMINEKVEAKAKRGGRRGSADR